jgi:ABC-type multidrug transport system ATPase subunit
LLIGFLYLFPDFALRQTLLGVPNNFTQFYLSMLVTIVVLGAILLYVCEVPYRRDRCNLYWHQLLQGSLCKKLSGKMNGERIYGVRDEDLELGVRSTVGKNQPYEDYSIVVLGLSKKYLNAQTIEGISFALKKGDCFGLIGKSGAGKTTILNMMTLCETKTSGSIEVNKINCQNDEFQYKSQFGYCPQVDALNPMLTPFETLKFTALVRGIPHRLLANTISYWLERMNIAENRDCQVCRLSFSTKRKLSVAAAIIGNPPVIFLDEPTTGLDPTSRRIIWDCIKEYQNQNKTIVLTSQSMEECEKLCNRMAVINHGQLGRSQDLMSTYGKGFKLTIELKETMTNNDAVENLKKDVLMPYFSCQRQYKHDAVSISNISKSSRVNTFVCWSKYAFCGFQQNFVVTFPKEKLEITQFDEEISFQDS